VNTVLITWFYFAFSKLTQKPTRPEQGCFWRSGASVSLFTLRRISTPHNWIFRIWWKTQIWEG